MRLKSLLVGCLVAAIACGPALAAQKKKAPAAKGLDIYFIDVEGGQATLFVSPSGESMLVDVGFPGIRDAQRIVGTAAQAGIKRIDYLVVTHYHADHVGGVTELAKRMTIGTFVDHGPNADAATKGAYDLYVAARGAAKNIVAKPGDKLPIKGIEVQFVSAATNVIATPLKGAGAPNPQCTEFEARDESKDPLLGGENAQSVGMIVSLGKFRMADFGDLTWNYEHKLACPNNLVGKIDLYLTTHHGQEISGLPILMNALRPRAAIMNNGAKKGAAPETFGRLHAVPGLTEVWQLHASETAREFNSADDVIANLDEQTAYDIRVTGRPNGSFTVTNSRNDNKKVYGPHN